MNDYICKIATLDDIIQKYDMEIKGCDDSTKLTEWKQIAIERYKSKSTITYIGLLNNNIISECSATLNPSVIDNGLDLSNSDTAYLHGFYTHKEYQDQGYFSLLFKYMINDLKKRGYKKVTLGVVSDDEKNKMIYNKYGFTNYIKTVRETSDAGDIVKVEYYWKKI